MKHTVQILIAIIYVSGIYGCDFLEKTPTELAPETYYKNADEAFSALVGVYSVLSSHMFYGENVIYLLCGDDLSYYGGNRQPATKGIICNNATVSDASTNNMWFILYTGIDRANQFLENIGRIPVDDLSEDLRLQYIAEARFLRAFYYFHLVQGWGDVPFKTTATHSVNNLQIAATDRQTIYDFIISEMDYAASNGLKSASELSYQPGYISQSAAWGIIARVYLFRAGEHYRQDRAANDAETSTYFAKAKEYAEKVLFEGHSLATNYWDYFIDLCSDNYNTTANESIWEVEFTGNYEGDIRAEGRWGNMIGMSSPDLSMYNFSGKADPGYSPAVIHCTPKLYNLYVKNNDICRMNWSISPFIYEFNTVDGVYGRRFHKGKMNEVMAQYGIPEEKISVVHNAVSRNDIRKSVVIPERCRHEKRVLFMGRVTYQKGPDYFVEAAKLVLDRLPHTRFIMAGSGDMLPNMVRRVAHLRIGDRFHFTGFLRNGEVDRMYAMSDLYVMPSVSEPFGIAPLEAMAYDVPVLISRQSGVAEVVRNAIKVDFWDVREMANKICALLAYPLLAAEEVRNCREELKNIRWENAATKLRAIYDQLAAGRR